MAVLPDRAITQLPLSGDFESRRATDDRWRRAQPRLVWARSRSVRSRSAGVCSRSSLRCRRSIAVRAHEAGLPRSDTTTIVRNASGTDHGAGWATRMASQPVTGTPTSVPAMAPDDVTRPTSTPDIAPATVRRDHQMPSTSSGQNVEAATVNAQVTRMPASSRIACSARSTTTAAAGEQVVGDGAGDDEQQAERGGQERGERTAGEQGGEHRAGPAVVHLRRKRDDGGVGGAVEVELRDEDAAEDAVDAGEQVEDAEQPDGEGGGSACGAAVGAGVEAHDHVREPHGAEGERDDERPGAEEWVSRVGEVEERAGPAVAAGPGLAADLWDLRAFRKRDGGALRDFPATGPAVKGLLQLESGADGELDGGVLGEPG